MSGPGAGQGSVTLEADGPVAVLTLNRPEKLNAITPEMASQLQDHVDRLNHDSSVRAVVLTGAGEKSFCVGSDVSELSRYETVWEFRNREDYGDAVRELRKPVIAAVNGYAFGGGLELAMACDIRLASTAATFAAPEIKLGWIGGAGQAVGLAQSIGPSNAALLLLTGDPVDAPTALSWGLVSRVHEPNQLLVQAQVLASTIAKRAPIAAESVKVNLWAAYSTSPDVAVRYERDLQAICFATKDAVEGRAAFLERREPRFEGR